MTRLDLNDPNDPAVKMAKRYMDFIYEKYCRENPCPVCGSHNVDIELNWMNGAHMSGSEWCNECGWKKDTET